MNPFHCLLALLLVVIAGAAQARDLKLTIIEFDADDIACGLLYSAVQEEARRSMAIMKAREAPDADHELLVAIATVKRPADCASDVIVSVRRTVSLLGTEKIRTRDNKAALELCRHGGIVVSPLADHGRDFLKQVERSVQVCLGQLVY